METETLKKLVEMAGIGCSTNEIQTSLNLHLTPELLALIHEVRQRARELIPLPIQAQIRRQFYLNRLNSLPKGCNPFF